MHDTAICLQVYISNDLCVPFAVPGHGVSISEWVGALVRRACDDEDAGGKGDAAIDRIARQSVFLMVGVDALLAGHPDRVCASARTRPTPANARSWVCFPLS